ncbi:MAG: hypothetical protein Q9181_003891 [Wetmoreana brouardii]
MYTAPRAPILTSSGWSGPGGKSSPQNSAEYQTYKAVKASVRAREQEKRNAENKLREIEGLPPLVVKEGFGKKVKKGLLKVL